MSWSINSVWKILRRTCFGFALAWAAGGMNQVAASQDLRVPAAASAGEEATISTTGSGSAHFYLVGPGVAQKRDVMLGENIRVSPETLRYAGVYLAIVCVETCHNGQFTVTPAQPVKLSFLVHPSRVPANQPDAVSGVAFTFDRFGNGVIAPLDLNIQVAGTAESIFSRSISTHDGIAWFRTASGKRAGALRVTASYGEFSAVRVVQQVAAEPCNLRIKGERTSKGIQLETEPVHDCSSNPVSDGTIVTFKAAGSGEESTIDAPIKAGIARARVTDPRPVVVSAASGVAMANEVRIGGTKP